MSIISKDDMPRFKLSYNQAIKNKEAGFNFKGQFILVSYAKYVIEYFTNERPKKV